MDQFLLDKILKSIPLKYYVINVKTKKIVNTNIDGLEVNSPVCYKQIYKKDLPCDLQGGHCICESLLQKNMQGEFITEIEKIDGKQILKTNATRLTDVLVLETITDITDEKLLKRELKINSKRLERAEMLADFGYWEFNIDDKIVLASEGARRIYGVSDASLPLSEVKKYPLPKYRKELDENIRDLILENKPYNVKFEIKRKSDGEIRQVRSIAEYRKDKKMVFGVLHDITENNKAQNALVESEKNLQFLFQNMNSAFAHHKIVTNNEGVPVDYIFLDVNNKFEELTGLKRAEIIGKGVKTLFPQIEDSWIRRYGTVALTGEPVKFTDYSAEIDKYIEVSAYSPLKEYFAVTFTDVTQKIKSEKTLDDTLVNLKLAQKIAKLGNWQFDPDNNSTSYSEEVFKIIERDTSSQHFTRDEFISFFGEENYNQFSKFINLAVNKGIPFQFQFKSNVSTGKTKWIEIICQPESEPGINGYKLKGTIQDINESKQIEVELNNSNKLLRTVIDNIPDAIYMKDKNFRKLVANKKDAERCRINDINDIVGKTDFDLYPKEIAEKYADDDRKVFETGMPIINQEEFLPDGDGFSWVLTSKIPLKSDDNEIFGLVGIGRDITEIKENESRLRLLQQVIEQSPLSVVITDTNGEIEYVNPGFEKATGYSREEAIGKNPRMLNSGSQDKSYYTNMWNTILAGNNWHGEFHNKRKDGTLYWESVVIAPICDENKEIKQFVAIKEDVTNIKQMVKDLEIAKEKAEESDRLKTVFLANMSHEIRTPLNGILGFSNIICSGLCDEDQLIKYSKIIENSGQRLMTVIDDIIDISMIQANQFKVELKEFDLKYLLDEIFVVYKNQKADKLDKIRFELESKLTRDNSIIVSDKNRIYQVLKNLLDNAFKFTSSGYIKFGCYVADDSQIVLFVEDSGIGIDEDKIDLIFEIFRQVEEGSSRKYEGSGLGLAITSGIVEKLGGQIVVQSEIKKGTTFYITLPRNTHTTSKINGKTNHSVKMKEKEIKFKRIVSFEDDKASAHYLKVVAKLLGYELTNFENAIEGIEYLRIYKADLILMDAQLPGMNGYEATRIIKSEMPGIPIIMQSAFAMKSDVDKAIKAGCDDYISKPVSMNNLKEKIEKFITVPKVKIHQ